MWTSLGRDICVGEQQKQYVNIQVGHGNIADVVDMDLDSPEHIAAHRHSLRHLLSSRLSALFIPHSNSALDRIAGRSFSLIQMILKPKPKTGPASSQSVKMFTKASEASTEFFFPSFEQQIETLKRQIGGTERIYFEPGDVFVTRHSNILDIHLAFHIIIASSKAEPNRFAVWYEKKYFVLDFNNHFLQQGTERLAWTSGVRDALLVASENGVETLTIPLILSEHSHMMRGEVSPQCKLQAVELVRCVHSSLADISRRQQTHNSLRTIRFLLPEISKRCTTTESSLPSKQLQEIIRDVFHIIE